MPRGDSDRETLLAAAVRLFSAHGVAGTSLQMIATELGVTKAAVYHHFRAKDGIVLAALAPAFAHIAQVVDAAEATPADRRAGVAVAGLADQAVANRALYAVLLRDVAVRPLVERDPALAALFDRLNAVLLGPAPGPGTRVGVAIFLAGLVAPANTPALAGLDDEELRAGIVAAGTAVVGARP